MLATGIDSIKSYRLSCNFEVYLELLLEIAFGLNLWKSDMDNAYGTSGAGGLRDNLATLQ